MVTQKDLDRINELYRKSKAEGLTEAEAEEQKRLRKEYVEAFRNNLRGTLESIKIQNPDGTMIDVKQRHDKKILRKKSRMLRDAMTPDERAEKSKLILKKLVGTDEYRNAENILTYVSTGSEVETIEFIKLCLVDGKNTFVPKVYGSEMKFIQIKSLDELAEGYYGILEPKQDEPVWDDKGYSVGESTTTAKTLCIMPGLAFDNHFNRIGYGGGFYDKFLQKHLNIFRIAICFECQIVDAIDAEDTDIKPVMIITDREVMKNGQH